MLDVTDKIVLIDYEYADHNYRGIDIPNILNDICFTYDPEYPFYVYDEKRRLSSEEVEEFIQFYVLFSKFKPTESEVERLMSENGSFLTGYVKEKVKLEMFKKEVDDILEETRLCSLFTHYYWVFWCLISPKDLKTMTEYLPWAHKRWQLYQSEKKAIFGEKSL